ncbi:Protein kinase domain-containing protein [Aphelenchoides besseyi]|nr:Protein kinase domain-containing protein [Aphelenchoides besseyi]
MSSIDSFAKSNGDEQQIQLFGQDATNGDKVRKLVVGLLVNCLVDAVPATKKEDVRNGIITLLSQGTLTTNDIPDRIFVDKLKCTSIFREFNKLILTQTATATNLLLSNAQTPQFAIRNAIKLSDFDIIGSIVNSRYAEEFEEEQKIGSGGFGAVYKVRSRIDRQYYAVKKIALPSMNIELVEKTLQESRHHACLDSRHIVRYHASWIELRFDNRKETRKAHSEITNSGDVFAARQPGVYKITSESSDSFICFSNGSGNSIKKPSDDAKVANTPIISFVDSDSDSTDSTPAVVELNENDDGGSSGNSSDVSSEDCKIVALNRPKRYSHTTVENDWKITNHTNGPCPILHIQMELCHASLEAFMLQRDIQPMARVDTDFNARVVEDVLSAIEFLHSHSIIHRDIKHQLKDIHDCRAVLQTIIITSICIEPSNVLLKQLATGQIRCLLSDFGLAVSTTEVTEKNNEEDGFLINPFPPRSRRTRGIGTVLYASPEQLHSSNYDTASDIYSAGIVIYELYHIFKSRMERVHSLRLLRANGPTAEFTVEYPEVSGLVRAMTLKKPSERPTARQLLERIQAMKEITENGRLKQQVDSLKARNRHLMKEVEEWKTKYESILRELNSSNNEKTS